MSGWASPAGPAREAVCSPWTRAGSRTTWRRSGATTARWPGCRRPPGPGHPSTSAPPSPASPPRASTWRSPDSLRFRGAAVPRWPEGVPVAGRDVLLSDDGLATGATVRAALGELRAGAPRRLVFASPVRAAELAAALRADGDPDGGGGGVAPVVLGGGGRG